MKKIVVLTDYSHKSEHAAEIALKIAERTGSKVIFYNSFSVPDLVPPVTSSVTAYSEYQEIQLSSLKRLESFAEKVCDKLYEKRHDARPDIACISDEGILTRNVSAFLKSKGQVWFVVMGDKSSNGGFFEHLVSDSETEELINELNRPILLVPEKARFSGLKSIALATGLDKTDYKALKLLLELGKYFNSNITLLHVCKDRLSLEQKLKNIELLNKIKSKVHYPEITYEDVAGTELSATLEKFASAEKINMLAVIHRKHYVFERLFHRSTTEEMLQYHKLPLMVFPPGFK